MLLGGVGKLSSWQRLRPVQQEESAEALAVYHRATPLTNWVHRMKNILCGSNWALSTQGTGRRWRWAVSTAAALSRNS